MIVHVYFLPYRNNITSIIMYTCNYYSALHNTVASYRRVGALSISVYLVLQKLVFKG